MDTPNRPRVVVVGGGFGGLAVVRGLRGAPVEVALIDRTNHHVFQPLLYQVATAMLTPGQIAAPLRQVLSSQDNVSVLLGDVTGVSPESREVVYRPPGGEPQRIGFDFLVLATGVENFYYGSDVFPKFAPGLKSLAEATEIRNKVLAAFEQAETEPDPAKRRALMSFVLIGGGATGVEMAGAIAELARLTMRRDFRRIDPEQARVVLIEGGPRVLAQFEEELSAAARDRLMRIGVDVVTGARVESIDVGGVVAAGKRYDARTVIWCAGMKASPAADWLGADADRMGRVKVNPDLTVGADPRVFVLGDTACLEQDGKPLPGVAQVALQQGHYVARLIRKRLEGDVAVEPFAYKDPGAMAVVGRNFAVMELGRLRLAGFVAWVAWSLIHVLYLALPNLRVAVSLQWVWSYLSKQRGSRLIVWPRSR